jgi:DNA-binding transcriptional MerR regulator
MIARPHLLKIGDFARLAETNLRTLRYYEELGLLAPATRSEGGFRYYRETDVHRVNMIRDLQALGLALERIRDLITGPGPGEGRAAYLDRIQTALREHDRLLRERMAALEAQRERVGHALQKLEQCRGCPHTPHAENNFCEPCLQTGRELPEHLSALF